MRAGSETRERSTDTASSNNAQGKRSGPLATGVQCVARGNRKVHRHCFLALRGGGNGRRWRPFAPPVTCVAGGNGEATHVTVFLPATLFLKALASIQGSMLVPALLACALASSHRPCGDTEGLGLW